MHNAVKAVILQMHNRKNYGQLLINNILQYNGMNIRYIHNFITAGAFAVSVCAFGMEYTDTLGTAQSLSEVVVTGSNQALRSNLLPYTVSVVDSRQLEAVGSTQLLSALSGRVPSLFVTERSILGFGVSSNGGSGHIKMRGVGGDRASAVLMMVDGQPQFAGIYSHHVADFYEKDNVERVEVLRGPGSVLYGSNAMAGVINVITKRERKPGNHTVLTTQYGSYNTWLTTLTNSSRFGRFSSMLSLSYDRTDGTCDNFDFKQMSGYAKVGYDINANWKSSVDYTLMNFKGNDPIFPRLNDPSSTAIYHQSITRGDASLTVSNRYGDQTSGDIRVYYSYGNHFIDDPRHFHSLDDRFGAMLYQNFTPWSGADATAGFDFDIYSGRIPVSGGQEHRPGSLQTMERQKIKEYSPYLTLAQSLLGERLVLNGGVRMANSNRFTTRWIPQGGIVGNLPSGTTLKGSVAMGYRNPSFRELYLYRMANPDLRPEKMMNYEVSASQKWGHILGASVTLYYSSGSEMIQTVDMRNVNTGRFINKGVEISLDSRPMNHLWLNASYSYLHSSLDNLTGAPRHQYSLGADWQALRRLTVSAQMKGVARLYVSDLTPLQSFATLDFKISYTPCEYATVFARLENVTDARYTLMRGYPMPGFTAMGGVKLSFSTR